MSQVVTTSGAVTAAGLRGAVFAVTHVLAAPASPEGAPALPPITLDNVHGARHMPDSRRNRGNAAGARHEMALLRQAVTDMGGAADAAAAAATDTGGAAGAAARPLVVVDVTARDDAVDAIAGPHDIVTSAGGRCIAAASVRSEAVAAAAAEWPSMPTTCQACGVASSLKRSLMVGSDDVAVDRRVAVASDAGWRPRCGFLRLPVNDAAARTAAPVAAYYLNAVGLAARESGAAVLLMPGAAPDSLAKLVAMGVDPRRCAVAISRLTHEQRADAAAIGAVLLNDGTESAALHPRPESESDATRGIAVPAERLLLGGPLECRDIDLQRCGGPGAVPASSGRARPFDGGFLAWLMWATPPRKKKIPPIMLPCSLCQEDFDVAPDKHYRKFTFIYCTRACFDRHRGKKFAA